MKVAIARGIFFGGLALVVVGLLTVRLDPETNGVAIATLCGGAIGVVFGGGSWYFAFRRDQRETERHPLEMRKLAAETLRAEAETRNAVAVGRAIVTIGDASWPGKQVAVQILNTGQSDAEASVEMAVFKIARQDGVRFGKPFVLTVPRGSTALACAPGLPDNKPPEIVIRDRPTDAVGPLPEDAARFKKLITGPGFRRDPIGTLPPPAE